MKKIIPVLVIVLCLVVVLCACGEQTPQEPQGIEGLNSKLSYDYSGWDIKVITLKHNVRLINEFKVTKRDGDFEIKYTLEKLNEISLENPTADFKSVSSGTAIVKDGKVYVDDDTTGIAFENLTTIGLNFKEDYFENATLKTTIFDATVTSTKDFCCIENASNMSVLAAFEENTFRYITISYSAQDGANVSMRYEFHA